MDKQPTINIGTLGHVSHGKSTLTRVLTNISTGKYKEEKQRNMTIKLGYANFKIWQCCSSSTSQSDVFSKLCDVCGTEMILKKHISIVDSPGHADLIGTMLSGASVMDYALMIVSANDECPSNQTIEHLIAAEEYDLSSRLFFIQNKIDLCDEKTIIENKNKILEFSMGTKAEYRPIIPISAQLNIGIDIVLNTLANIPEPVRDIRSDPLLYIVRTFDINKPGTEVSMLKGGVFGGSLIRGKLNVGDEIEIRPGLQFKNGTFIPITSKIIELQSENNKLENAIPGGLITLLTDVDPFFAKSDQFVGQVVGIKGTLPDVYNSIKVKYKPLRKTVDGSKTSINLKENVMLCIGACKCIGTITHKDKRNLSINLSSLVCIDPGSHITIFQNKRLIGTCEFISGDKCNQTTMSFKLENKTDNGSQNDTTVKPEHSYIDREYVKGDTLQMIDSTDPYSDPCYYYGKRYPTKNENVMCEVVSIDENSGVVVKLKEYNNCEGLLPLNQISNKKVKFVHKELPISSLVVCCVTNIEPDKGIIDVSKKYVTVDEQKIKREYFSLTKKLIQLIKRLDNKLYYEFCPLYEMIENIHPFDFMLQYSRDKDCDEIAFIRKNLNVSDNIFDSFIQLFKSYTSDTIRIHIVLLIKSTMGIHNIQNFLSNTEYKIQYVGSSKYRFEFVGVQYDVVNKICDQIIYDAGKVNISITKDSEPIIVKS
jgi:translation initiation factor 2 subunit 3